MNTLGGQCAGNVWFLDLPFGHARSNLMRPQNGSPSPPRNHSAAVEICFAAFTDQHMRNIFNALRVLQLLPQLKLLQIYSR